MKNYKQKVKVSCKEGRESNAYCSKLPNKGSWQLRKGVDISSFSIDYNGKMMNTKWLSKMIHNYLENDSNMKIKNVKKKAQRK